MPPRKTVEKATVVRHLEGRPRRTVFRTIARVVSTTVSPAVKRAVFKTVETGRPRRTAVSRTVSRLFRCLKGVKTGRLNGHIVSFAVSPTVQDFGGCTDFPECRKGVARHFCRVCDQPFPKRLAFGPSPDLPKFRRGGKPATLWAQIEQPDPEYGGATMV
jgi:hypothetical protein